MSNTKKKARVVIIGGGPTGVELAGVLPAMCVEVRTNTMVTDITQHGAHVGDEYILTESVFWAA